MRGGLGWYRRGGPPGHPSGPGQQADADRRAWPRTSEPNCPDGIGNGQTPGPIGIGRTTAAGAPASLADRPSLLPVPASRPSAGGSTQSTRRVWALDGATGGPDSSLNSRAGPADFVIVLISALTVRVHGVER